MLGSRKTAVRTYGKRAYRVMPALQKLGDASERYHQAMKQPSTANGADCDSSSDADSESGTLSAKPEPDKSSMSGRLNAVDSQKSPELKSSLPALDISPPDRGLSAASRVKASPEISTPIASQSDLKTGDLSPMASPILTCKDAAPFAPFHAATPIIRNCRIDSSPQLSPHGSHQDDLSRQSPAASISSHVDGNATPQLPTANANRHNPINGDDASLYDGQETALIGDLTADMNRMSIIGRLESSGKCTARLGALFKACSQSDPADFDQFIADLCRKSRVNKIGEATFAEVFTTTVSGKDVAIKVIPFGEDRGVIVNEEPQSSTANVLHEVTITTRLSALSNRLNLCFARCVSAAVCRGTYPERLLNAWDRWHKRNTSENTRPDMFTGDQTYCVLVLEHGGTDLEHIQLEDWQQAVSVVRQVISTLAVAESECEFEHRDLHWGNILIKPADSDMIGLFGGREYPTNGVRATIIDYTFSRLQNLDSAVLYRPYDDESYFTGTGDYQYDIYRLMREAVMTSDGSWQDFCPKTNVYWIHYLVKKMLGEDDIVRRRKRAATAIDASRHLLLEFSDRVLNYTSASELVARDALILEHKILVIYLAY